ncbi:MAG: metallophosphoesterase family protein [Candidatus Aminicenantes bacterium]|nr:metallophosphoesterase family protein [Candidatus Aminicenantes bacterium]
MGAKEKKLTWLYKSIKDPIKIDSQKDRYVFFSDQHIGMPEFDRNKQLYLKALDYYYEAGFTLVVLGDFEELHRYGIKKIKRRYNDVYASERRFLFEKRYYRIYGNHDIDWRSPRRVKKHLHEVMPGLTVYEALRFDWEGNNIFLAHGHQGDFLNDTLGIVGRIVLRCLARPLDISSLTSPAKRYTKRRKDEEKFYIWAKKHKILFIAGHTHRPMFESLTKGDRIRIDIENNLRKYVQSTNEQAKQNIEQQIKKLKKDFDEHVQEEGKKNWSSGFGGPELVIPCYSNDGSCLHRSGITCIELEKRRIRLVFVYDESISANTEKYLRAPTIPLVPADPKASMYKKQILEDEDLDYIFTRIRFLS